MLEFVHIFKEVIQQYLPQLRKWMREIIRFIWTTHVCTVSSENFDVSIVGNHSASLQTTLHAYALMQEKNPFHFNIVGDHSLSWNAWQGAAAVV